MTTSAIRRGMYGKYLGENDDGTFNIESYLSIRRKLKVTSSGKVYYYNPTCRWNSKAKEWIAANPRIYIPESEFFKTETELSLYDDALKDPDYYYYSKGYTVSLKYLLPLEYLRMCARGRFNRSTQSRGISVQDEILGANKSAVSRYANQMREGKFNSKGKFPVPMIEIDERDGSIHQEGRHRVLAIQKLIDEGHLKKNYTIPVVVLRRLRTNGCYD